MNDPKRISEDLISFPATSSKKPNEVIPPAGKKTLIKFLLRKSLVQFTKVTLAPATLKLCLYNKA